MCASASESPLRLPDVCRWFVVSFVEEGPSVRVNFAKLKKKFDDPYTHEEYDLSEVLASVDIPFLVYEMSLLASGHVEFGMRLRDAAAGAGDCHEGEATVCHALRCLAERLFVLADRLRLDEP